MSVRLAWVASVMLWVGVCLPAAGFAAQNGGDGDNSPRPLTVWVVRPVTAADRAVQRAAADLKAISTYHESTAGSFGTSASDVGQTAGSYGKSASDVGRNAGSVGVNAGDYGRSPSDLPSNVPSQTAGSYGTTSGSFGTSASDYTGAPSKAAEAAQNEYLLKTPEWQRFVDDARVALPSVRATYVEVRGLELHERLAKALGTSAYPDVLLLPSADFPNLVIGEQAPDESPGERDAALDGVALLRVGRPFAWPVVRAADTALGNAQGHAAARSRPYGHALGTVRGPHPGAEREYLEWLDEGRGRTLGSHQISPESREAVPAAIAMQATESIFSGGTAEAWADTQMAQFTLQNAVTILYVARDRVPADLHVRSEVLGAEANDRFAVVLLHSEVVSEHAYGRFFPLVVLRRTAGGQWKVLHLSVDLSEETANQAFRLLRACAEPAGPHGPAQVMPVSLASPRDGEQRAASGGLELWWDDTSNAKVLVVEYQSLTRLGPDRPHLFVVDDREAKLQTRVSVPFGEGLGTTRWRVWSVGDGGALQLTPWRNLNLIR